MKRRGKDDEVKEGLIGVGKHRRERRGEGRGSERGRKNINREEEWVREGGEQRRRRQEMGKGKQKRRKEKKYRKLTKGKRTEGGGNGRTEKDE